jgi:hypothetical protein
VIRRLLFTLGEIFLDVAQQVGGVAIMLVRIISRLIPPKIDFPEFKRSLYKMGVQSLPIVIVTSLLTGAIGVIQAAYLVKRYNAYNMVGAGAGFGVVRELGPVLGQQLRPLDRHLPAHPPGVVIADGVVRQIDEDREPLVLGGGHEHAAHQRDELGRVQLLGHGSSSSRPHRSPDSTTTARECGRRK